MAEPCMDRRPDAAAAPRGPRVGLWPGPGNAPHGPSAARHSPGPARHGPSAARCGAGGGGGGGQGECAVSR
jgi:hypothetical protein